MPGFYSLLMLVFVLTTASADETSEQVAVMRVIDAFFSGMTAKDIDSMQKIMTDDGVLYGYRDSSDGPDVVSISHADYLQNLASRDGIPVERIWNPERESPLGPLAQGKPAR